MQKDQLAFEKLPPRPGADQNGAGTSNDDNGKQIRLPGAEFDLQKMTREEISEKIEVILLERIKQGSVLAMFQLGQLYFEQEEYENAVKYFKKAAEKGDYQAMYQLGILYYDGLGVEQDHKKGYQYMETVANATSKNAQHLVRAAQYNLGKAYFQGYGVPRRSDDEAERYWLLAADDGNPQASVKAQSTLGMFYSLRFTSNLDKAFFWHSEACGNGSLESQGALGVMYQNGLGCKQSDENAFVCFREASERGNVFAMGNLVAYYYRRKLYTKCLELATRVAHLENLDKIALGTECQEIFVKKGVALACFYYARLLHNGIAVKKDESLAQEYYSKSYSYDADTCAQMQALVQRGVI